MGIWFLLFLGEGVTLTFGVSFLYILLVIPYRICHLYIYPVTIQKRVMVHREVMNTDLSSREPLREQTYLPDPFQTPLHTDNS
jgi:hypothetical protein